MDKELLDAPCVFCGYNGANYWQVKTHGKLCPWYSMGGIAEREGMLRKVIANYRKLPKEKPPLATNPYTTEYKYQCSMDAGMPQNLVVNDDGYVGFGEGTLAQREIDIAYYSVV